MAWMTPAVPRPGGGRGAWAARSASKQAGDSRGRPCAVHGGGGGGDSNRAVCSAPEPRSAPPLAALATSQRRHSAQAALPARTPEAPEAAPLSRGLSPAALPPRRPTAPHSALRPASHAPHRPAALESAQRARPCSLRCARLSQGPSRNGGPCRGVARRTRAGGRAAVHHALPHDRLAGREPPPIRCEQAI